MRTWHVEAGAQAAIYLGVLLAQHGTLVRPELAIVGALWFLGRVASRIERLRERYARDGVAAVLESDAAEVAGGTERDLRLASALLGGLGLIAGIWVLVADAAWTVLYPVWRRAYRGAW